MTKLIVHTHLAAAAKITFDLEDGPSGISFEPLGGGDGVPPGMVIKGGQKILLWVAAQDYGVAIVDEGNVTVESNVATPS